MSRSNPMNGCPSRAARRVRDLVVDRSALDRVLQAGGYVSVRAGGAPDANALPVTHDAAERARHAGALVGPLAAGRGGRATS